MKAMRLNMIAFCLLTLSAICVAGLEDEFRDPPEWTRPWCYWFFLNGDITEDGITKDLEKMKELGIQQAIVMHVQNSEPKDDYVRMMSPRWMELKRFALKEAGRCGIGISLHNCPGWSNAGGPWIKPEQSMRHVSWNEFDTQGGSFSRKVRPAGIAASQDIAVLAVPRKNSVTIKKPCITEKIEFTHSSSFTARSFSFVPNKDNYNLSAKLFAVQPAGQLVEVIEIDENVKGRNAFTSFLPFGDETYSFEGVKAETFLLQISSASGIESVELSSQPKVAQVIEKQMGRMFPSPMPDWDSYIFDDTTEPDNSKMIIDPKKIINLSDKLKADGTLTCQLPKGKWTVIWFGMKPTGKINHPASVEGTGLEVDKMSKTAIEYHFNSMLGKIISELTDQERSALNGVSIDSYEVGAQNWTDGFGKIFAERVGYDPIPYLPVLTGCVVESAKASDMFLWHLRRQIADAISINYVGGLRQVGNRHGLKLWLENYGHWGYPGEFLMYGGYSDYVAGEFWSTGTLGNIECRAASSCGHIYGKNRIYAEAYTSGIDLKHHPAFFKARGEQMFCDGINHFVLTVSIHQPQTGIPGKNPWYGTAFHRNTPWYNKSHSFVKYLQRIHLMLQKGEPVADVAVYIGDFAPQMTGPPNPVPVGYDFDYINSDVIMNRLKVVDGDWVVYDENDPERIAARWKLLAMPMDKLKYIRPQVLASLDKLKKQGGNVVDSVPVSAEHLEKMGVLPAVYDTTCAIRWKQRQTEDADIFFVSNFQKAGSFSATFRSKGKSVEILNPYNGQSYKTAWFKNVPNGTRVTIDVKDKSDSFFVVMRQGKVMPSVVSVQRDGKDVSADSIKLSYNKKGKLVAETALAGKYIVKLSNGKARKMSVKDMASQIINGQWKINFGTENSTATEAFSVETDKLLSWDKLTDARARKFTGTAHYETTFTVDSKLLKRNRRVYLDLGSVNVMAGITVNGKTLETLWMPPFRADITELLKKGQNKLRVEITSTSPCESPGLLGPVRLINFTRKELF
jgi:hypothetical protein